MLQRTKIVATLGPASESVAVITKLVKAGLSVARLNFSHGTFRNHAALIRRIRQVSKTLGVPVAILQDLPGPKIRVGDLPHAGLELKKGHTIVFETGVSEYRRGFIPVGFAGLAQAVSAGQRLLLDDGKLEAVVEEVMGSKIVAQVVQGGILLPHKGINVPDTTASIAALTDKDREAVKFGVEHGVDFIALSFVNRAEDITELRALVEMHQAEVRGKEAKTPIHLIAKIERQEALKNSQSIIAVADGIMVARGDLGIEIPAAEVPLAQQKLIAEARAAAKPVIVATQMLDSMQKNPRPTRAEVSDVATAVMAQADAVMLSNETAAGEFPVETVSTMATIIQTVEAGMAPIPAPAWPRSNTPTAVATVARDLAEQVGAVIIATAAENGVAGRLIATTRPRMITAVMTGNARVERQLQLLWGVYPVHTKVSHTVEGLTKQIMGAIKDRDLARAGDKVVVVAGEPVGESQHCNMLIVKDII